MWRTGRVGVVALALVAALAPAFGQQQPDQALPGLASVLFHDTQLQRPAESGVDERIDMTLTGYNDCSKLWLGSLTLPVGGRVVLDAEAQQGIRLYLSGELVIDGWSPEGVRQGAVEVQAGGSLPLRLEYYHLGGEAFARLYWTLPGRERQLVPAAAFSHRPEDAAHAAAIAAGKEWVGVRSQGPMPRQNTPHSVPKGDEPVRAFIYGHGEPAPTPGDTPIEIGPGPHLFVDDYLIAQARGFERRVRCPRRDPDLPNPIINGVTDRNFQPFLTVLRDPQSDRFRVWYGTWTDNQDTAVSHIGYMESDDGVDWERPHRVLADPAPIQFGDSVVDDGPDCADPEHRYKLGWWRDGGLKIATSPDGLDWRPLAPEPVILHNHDITNIAWDPLREHYVATVSVYTAGPTWTGLRRATMHSTSRDLLEWTEPWYVLTPVDGVDEGETQFYAMNGYLSRGDLRIGLVKVLRDDLKASGVPEGAYGVGYTTLAWTRDGLHWTRDKEPFFEPDPNPEAWDHAHAWMDYQVPVGEQVCVYYGGYTSGHKWNRFEQRQIGLVQIPRDRYVARHAGAEEANLVTPSAVLRGGPMTVNADVRGELRVRITDASGTPLPGLDFADCEPIRGDSLDHPVRWVQSLDIAHGQTVRIEFRMTDGDLYGFLVPGTES